MFFNGRWSIRRRSLLPVASGMLIAQMVGTLFVFRSNASLLQQAYALKAAGWLALPAGPALEMLPTMGAALRGGLFYTLSVGTGLTLATWAGLYLVERCRSATSEIFHRIGIWSLALLLTVWLALGVYVNRDGWILYPTLFVVLVPLATALAAVHRKGREGRPASARLWPLPVVTLLLLTLLWASQMNDQLFVAIRDRLLLSNPVGSSVNDFYYRNTLYAAETFKSFQQKTIRTCKLAPDFGPALAQRLTTMLASRDVMAAPELVKVDLLLQRSGTDIVLSSAHGDRLKTSLARFMADPDGWLKKYSAASDRFARFRRVVFFGLLLGFPILLYVAVDGVIGRLAGLALDPSRTLWVRCGVCMAVGILLFIPMLARPPAPVSTQSIGQALASDDLESRVTALKLVEQKKIDLAGYPQYRRLLQSPNVVERYYLARALGFSRGAATFEDLLLLIRDEHPNVVCQAYFALGQRGDRAGVTPIKTQMVRSVHWYTQWYAYRAMRRLGWHQTLLK